MFPLSNPEPARLVPTPAQATAAKRLGTSSRPSGRLALGVLLVLVAVLGGALFLQRAQRLEPKGWLATQPCELECRRKAAAEIL